MRNLFLSIAVALGIFAVTPVVDIPLQGIGIEIVTDAIAAKKKSCGGGSSGLVSTECGPETNNKYRGTGGKKPTLRPTVCLSDSAYDLMTGPGVDFWFDYELNYPGGGQEKGDGVIRRQCSDKQWVSPGTWLTFWVDCKGYRWFFTTARITSNAKYVFKLVKKVKI